jgi:hypothetical protein
MQQPPPSGYGPYSQQPGYGQQQGYPQRPPPKKGMGVGTILLIVGGVLAAVIFLSVAATLSGKPRTAGAAASAASEHASPSAAASPASPPAARGASAAGSPPDALAVIRGDKPLNSGWDGSCAPCEHYIKANLNDPSSYEHVGTTVAQIDGEYWTVMTRFRAKNAFGALVINEKKCFIQQGKVVKVE